MNVSKRTNSIILLIGLCTLVYIGVAFTKFAITQNKELSKYIQPKAKKEEDNVEGNSIIYASFIDGTKYSVTLEDNASAKEFVMRLPLTLSMTDLNSNEKYYYFDKPFVNNPQKVGKIYKGDLMLYGNDCIVLFYDTFETPYSYTRIGKLNAPNELEEKVGVGAVEITFSLE